MTDPTGDRLVADYLARLEAALADAAPDRRRELLDEIAAHLADARAELPGGGDEQAVRTLLDRLGEPGEIASAAREDGASDGSGAGPVPATSPGPEPLRPGWREGLAIPLLLIGGVIVPFLGWFAGVALLWSSRFWSTRDKLWGTLVVPFGLLPGLWLALSGGSTEGGTCSGWTDTSGRSFEQCTSTGGSGTDVVLLVLTVLLVVAPIAVSVMLGLRLRDRAPRPGRDATAAAA
jgi:hypothetical protein